MTHKLEQLFFGQESQTSDEFQVELQSEMAPAVEVKPSVELLSNIEKIEAALPQIRDLESSDGELDELGGMAKDAFTTLLDLGMQVEPRFSAEIFNSASSMLGHAITAKTTKINKKLKIIDLQLKKAEIDRKLSLTKTADSLATQKDLPQAVVVDRNELMRQLIESAKNNN